MQSHIRVLEATQENISVLLAGLEYLIDISYVDDTEVFKVWPFPACSLCLVANWKHLAKKSLDLM